MSALFALGAGGALAACGENPPAECVLASQCGGPVRPSKVAVGDTIRINARTNVPCDTVLSSDRATTGFRNGRVAAISDRAIVVADVGNPRGGFTDAQYQSIAVAFDTLVYPVDVRNFGEPTDLDENGRVIIFFTRAVNELTPEREDFVVGGFFWNRDLFPKTGNPQSACPGSNDGELFYMLAPDPTGEVNENPRSVQSVFNGTVAVIAHEFQHLINASRRLYVLETNNYDEVSWLNEGLSHVAEELSFYQAAGLSPAGQPGQSPRSRLTINALRNQPGAITALNTYNNQNLSRFSRYLRVTADSSPYANNDGLATRGGAWGFLRYAADRAGGSDSAFFQQLVNSTELGLDNLATVTGAGSALPDWFRDWAVANYADAVTAADPRFGYRSWQFRSLLPAVSSNNDQYPLGTQPLSNGRAETVTVVGGGAAYFPFTVPAGGSAAVRTRAAGGGALPQAMRVSLVRVGAADAAQGVTTYEPPGRGADVTAANTAATAARFALVVFNSSSDPRNRVPVTVTGTGLGAPPSTSVGLVADGALAQPGPTLARLADAADAQPPVSDAVLHARLRSVGQRELAWRVDEARATVRARRAGRAGAEPQ